MDNTLDDIVRAAAHCERAAQLFKVDPVFSISKQLNEATSQLAESWSGSWLGQHSLMYLSNFHRPVSGECFDPENGLQRSILNRTVGDWQVYNYDDVEAAILARAGVSDLSPIIDASKACTDAFHQSRDELLPTLDALISHHDDAVLRELREKLISLKPYIAKELFSKNQMPRNFVTRDYAAFAQTMQRVHVPPHISFESWLLERFSCAEQASEVAKIARHAERYLKQKHKMRGQTVARTEGTIFIGHGRSPAWREVQDFIQNRLHLEPNEFNREAVAGLTITQRLQAMLDNSVFALLILTAEDEHADGTKHARENVIHEVGLFQGRLGFQRAIILLEEGCTPFSNVHGILYIPFPPGRIKATFEEIRQVLEREWIIRSS